MFRKIFGDLGVLFFLSFILGHFYYFPSLFDFLIMQENAGDTKRMGHTKAYLSFLDATEKANNDKIDKKAKGTGVQSKDFYDVAVQLLEAEDSALLKMAAECLVRIGAFEIIHGARILELHARISYAQNNKAKVVGRKALFRAVAPSSNEQDHFEMAAQLYSKLMDDSKHNIKVHRMRIVDVIRNYLCTGREEFIMAAAHLVDVNHKHYLYLFKELQSLMYENLSDDKSMLLDPISYFRRMTREKQVECREFTDAFSKISTMACRHYHRKSDRIGLSTAISAIQEPAERLLMLMSLEEDASQAIKNTPWNNHPAFSDMILAGCSPPKTGNQMSNINLRELMVDELTSTGDFEKAGELLERRGDLLAAADNYSKRDEPFALARSYICRVRYVELVLKSRDVSDLTDSEFRRTHMEFLKIPPNLNQELIPTGTRASSIICGALLDLSQSENLLGELIKTADISILWTLEGLKALLLHFNFEGLMTRSNNLGLTFWQRSVCFHAVFRNVYPTITALLQPSEYRSQDQRSLIAKVESFYDLQSDSMSQVSTNNIWNLRLRESLLAEKKDLSSLTSMVKMNSFVSTLDRCKLHPVIAQYLCHSAIRLLVEYEQWLEEWSIHNFVDSLQARVICLNELRGLSSHKGIVELKPWWLDEVTVNADKKIQECVAQVFCFVSNPKPLSKNSIPSGDTVWVPEFLSVLKREVQRGICHLSMSQKKEDINALFILWRLLHLSSSSDDAMQALRKYLSELEHHPTIASDIKQNKNSHLLPQRGKPTARDALSIGRLLSWALDYVHRDQPDLIVAMKLICHLQWKVKFSRSLKSIDVDIQLTLIEANVAGLLGCLSCYCCSMNNGNGLWIMMPSHFYVDSFLRGVNCLYGRPFCEVIPFTVRAHFSEFAGLFDGFFQAICSAILDLNILSRKAFPDENQSLIGQLNRVLCLCFIISINAISIHSVCESITPDGLELPFRKLSGSAFKLMKEFFQALFDKRMPSHVQQCVSAVSPDKVAVQDLARIFSSILEISRGDRLISFRLDEKAFIEKRPYSKGSISQRASFKQILDDAEGEFDVGSTSLSKNMSVTFANEDSLAGVSVYKVFGLSGKVARDNGVLLTLDDLETLGLDERKRRAACLIQHAWCFHSGEMGRPGTFFRRFTLALSKFQRQVKSILSLSSDAEGDVQNRPSLASTEDLWSDESLKDAYSRWRPIVNSNNALFDSIECMYCNAVQDGKKRQARLNWCKIQCENESYYQGAKQYNLKHFGLPLAPFERESAKKEHERSDIHKKNVEDYKDTSDKKKNNVCKALADLECSILAMQKVINISDEKEESNTLHLSLKDEAYSLQVKLEASFNDIRKAALFWPYPKNIDLLLEEAFKLSENARVFFREKVKEEEEAINRLA